MLVHINDKVDRVFLKTKIGKINEIKHKTIHLVLFSIISFPYKQIISDRRFLLSKHWGLFRRCVVVQGIIAKSDAYTTHHVSETHTVFRRQQKLVCIRTDLTERIERIGPKVNLSPSGPNVLLLCWLY